MSLKLFRDEVVESRAKRAYGDVLIIYPVSNYVLTGLALALLTGLLIFFTLGHYTRHESVLGVLEPSRGVVKLFASQRGVLKVSSVDKGQTIHKGDVLLVFATEHEDADGKAIEEELNSRSIARLGEMHDELNGTLKIQQSDTANLLASLSTQQNSRDATRSQIQTLVARVRSAEQALERYEHLFRSGFMPDFQVQQKRDELLDQQLRLQDLQKSAMALDAEITRLRREIDNMPVRTAVIKAQLSRNISNAETDLSKQQNERAWSVVAPCDGVVASMTIAHNQTAEVGIPLVTIVPADSYLQAKLYAPSRSLGFMRVGQRVNIKVDAFPFQKFGFVSGKVVSIADTPATSAEISSGTRLAPNMNSGEPMYTIEVALDQQIINAYGQAQRLRPGMQLDADMQLDTRALYEWVFEPLYSMRRE